MQAKKGDRFVLFGQTFEIIETMGLDGTPPFLVRTPDGKEKLVTPPPDTVIDVDI